MDSMKLSLEGHSPGLSFTASKSFWLPYLQKTEEEILGELEEVGLFKLFPDLVCSDCDTSPVAMLAYLHALQKKIPLPESLKNPSVEINLNARAEIPQLVNISNVKVMRDLLDRIRVVQIHCARTGVFCHFS